ncbi:hypothetical protein L4B26_28275 [Bacillus toyonensis]|uniref:hypothetical protein n=1 Tax=Bacillus cereus group TaxID=86661 RepID=UPI001F0DB98B|nr:hypothetical protein [Bacillus toyonensis]MCH5455716.1 hypothetical protein [Bacillus toyonensis]HDR7471095.1 hypothetical protein [Bacillus toyonensis]
MTEIFNESQYHTVSGQGLQDSTFASEVQPIPSPGLGPMIPTAGQILGGTIVDFSFNHFGGTNNLEPGRPETLRVHVKRPEESNRTFVGISKINCGYINGNLDSPEMALRERPLGQMQVDVRAEGDDIVCTMQLTDENGDDPCVMRVGVNVLFF